MEGFIWKIILRPDRSLFSSSTVPGVRPQSSWPDLGHGPEETWSILVTVAMARVACQVLEENSHETQQIQVIRSIFIFLTGQREELTRPLVDFDVSNVENMTQRS